MTTAKFFKAALLVIFIGFAIPSSAMKTNLTISTLPSDSAADARIAAHIIQRVTEIQEMDKTNLTASEKRDLKKELRDMKKQAGALNQKVYISIGAIIIIILLLILIL